MSKKTKLALIDAHALIHRAYHALPPMSTSKGIPTNAVYGFVSMLLKVFTAIKPTHVVAAFDVKGPTFRVREFADYKAHRKPAPDDLIPQFDLVHQVVKAFNIPILAKTGFEADDIIGTLVEIIEPDIRKVIVTGDMDTLQLINDSTTVFTLKRGVSDTILYDEARVKETYGFEPKYLVDYKGLRGDPSDNIPGVKGVGDKTARELVTTYGSLENIFAHLKDLPPRVQNKLQGQESEALFSRRLATIRRDVPLTFSLEQAELADYDVQKVQKVFTELEFRSLWQRLPKAKTTIQPSLFRSHPSSSASAPALPPHYHVVESKADQATLQQRLAKAKLVSFDTETDRLGARTSPIVGMSFAVRPSTSSERPEEIEGRDKKGIEAWYVPTNRTKVKAWRKFFEDPAIKKIGHNLKYDMEVLQQSGIRMQGVTFDSMIASYVLQPGARAHSLDTLAIQELDYHPIPITDLIGQGQEQKTMSSIPLLDIARYAAEDAEVAFKLYEHFRPQIKDQGLTQVFEELEIPLVPILADIELTGVRIDRRVLQRLEKKMTARLTDIEEKIWELAGEKFNINSTQQLRQILYEKLNLATDRIARTQTGFSTAAAELQKLRGHHPIIELLEEYRELTKLLNTYITTLPKLVDPQTERIYTSFNQVVAATGRLSSSDPNLQNIPVRTALGQEIRGAFVADKGKQLVKADYSQIELRLAAHMSQDQKMIAAFRAGQDIHQATAAWVYGVPPEKVTSEQRRQAKTLNFGVLYGMGSRRFAQQAGISIEQARSFIGRYRQQYQGLSQFIETTLQLAQEQGYVETLFGRKRYVPELNSRTPAIRAQAERIAFNFPIQGTAADILKKAMIELHQALQKKYPEAKMVLTVHDELVAEAPQKQVQSVAALMKKVMENVFVLDVPLVAEVASGPNWKDLTPIS